ncbi:MAG: entericidin [Prevotella sp.]|nr:entericidin [Prevotella sp.]
MKKLVLMFVAIAAISFASCGNNSKPAANADSTADSTVDSTMSDSLSDSTATMDSVAQATDSVK